MFGTLQLFNLPEPFTLGVKPPFRQVMPKYCLLEGLAIPQGATME